LSYFYKSGDLVKFTSKGEMIYLGRIDRQVKIRGHRIEPGEIENQLIRHAAVKDAAVIDRENKDDTRHLCAYLVLHSPPGLDSPGTNLTTTLRDHLSARLPGYMVPSYFVYLDAIPLTPNGKLDRNALPEPVFTAVRDYEPPGNEREEKLVKIWAEILARKPHQPLPGIHDNFFELGGHSLNATIMTSKVREVFGIDVPLVEVFISPTIKALAEYIHAAKKEKSDLIKPVEEKEYYDTSYAQRRLWIICQFEDESAAYIMPNAFLLKGKFNQEAFTRAIQTLVNRHESLRTSFITIKGQPKQKIAQSLQFDLLQEDLSQLDTAEKEQQAKNLFAKFANQPFNLETGPLFQVKLIRLEQENYLLLSNIHHLITDGWAQGIVFSETIRLYNAFAAAGNPLPHLTYQYKDYSAWHNQLVDSGCLNKAEHYWLEKFKDKPNGIELPLDHSRQARQTFNGGTIYFSIDEEKTAGLRQLALQHDATLFMSYLTLLNILLYKYTGQEDMILGLASSGRDHPGLQQMMGFLVNTLVFRLLIRPNRDFKQLIEAARQETLDCFKQQDYPFNLLVEKLELERDLSRSPLFNVMLSQNNTGIEGLELNMTGLQVQQYTGTEGFNMSVFDLVFFMNDTGTGIEASIMYNSDLFQTQSIKRMVKNFQTLLDNILKNPNHSIASLDYINPLEYETIIHRFNDTDYPLPGKTVQELFEEQVEKTPHHTAVIYNTEKITYSLLNKKANQLAHFLRQTCGIHPNDIVAVAFERSIEMITAVMGILKAGAGYLAIDPNYPADRVSHMLTHSRSPLLILDKPYPELFPDYKGRIIDIHTDWHTIDRQPDFNPGIVNSPLDTIYVIYTSGSTGTPNGAMLSQDLLSNLLNWQRDKTGIDGSLRCLQFTTTSFCVSFQEIMTTLTSGGQLFLIGDIERQDIDYLMAFLVRHHIENLYLPFSYLNFLFNESNRFEAWFQQNLKHIITAGEQLKITAGLKTFLEANPSIKLHNHYGSSEMHVVTSYSLDAQTAELMPVPPAGTPIANTKIYILDQHRHPVPIGVWGELCIAGCSEIKGYINNKTLTDKKLLKHPVLSPGNNRLYCSGDIGRWLPDGNIELKGRIDSQVKIRGFRVELSEIESKILAIHRVKDCVVETKTDSQGQKYLAAYVVIQNIEISEIKKIISAYLPRHMIPKFIKLDSLPLMPNGKVDREHLPDPGTRQMPVPEPDPRQINRLLETGQLNDINWQNREFLLEKTGMEKILAYYTRQLQHLLFPDTTPLKVAAVNIEPPSPGEQETPQETLKLKPHITQPRQQIKNLDRLPLPDRSLVDYERYGKHIGLAMVKNTISIQATRGCPYHCLYCHKIWPKHHVVRSAKHIFKELELYYHMGFRRFVFVDDIFNLDIKNSTEFLNLIIEKGLKVYLFFPNGLRTDLLTREYIDLMIKAGTVSLGLALETASPRLQKLIKKNMNLEKLRDNVQYLCEKYPRVILELFLMHGFPTETEEEAIMTLDFLESLKWVDFPYFHLLKIYPHTDMADMAVKNGISKQAILDSANLAFHELPQTLPFEKSFTLTMQADFLNNYFLSKERLLAKLPHQIKVLTRDEIVQKYDSYLPTAINSIDDLLEFAGISKDELSDIGIEPRGFMADNTFSVPDLNKKLQAHFPAQPPDTDALRVLLLDLSRFFTSHGEMLYDTAEPPLGLMYLLTCLNREFPGKIKGKIAKSRTDFDSFQELKVLLEEFQPEVIGIRTLTFFNRLFHQAGAWIRQWGFTGPIIAGGPYATSDYETVLQDQNIDLAVLSEGEVTFAQLIGKIIQNHKQLPGEEILEKIPGIAFVPGKQKPEPSEKQPGSYAYVFNTSNPGILTALNQKRSLQLFPHDLHPKGIDVLEFYKKPGSTPLQEPTMEIRVILNNSFFPEANAPGEEKQAPRTETEKKLAEIWARVLGIDKNQIGIEDNFFELGGHSLKATTLASTIHKELHVKIPLTQIFKLQTLRELSDYIKSTRTEAFTSIAPVEEKEYYQLSSAQQRIFIRQQLNPGDTSYNNLSAVVLQGELKREKLTGTFAEMIRRHESFRTSFVTLEGEPVQEIHNKVEFEIEYYNMKEIETEVKVEEERSLILLISSFIRPFDLSRAPLLRVGLIKEQDNKHILLIDMHHIITDGVSHLVFSREIMALYDNKELPFIRCRYRDFTRWQQQLFTSGKIKKQENYWLKQYAGKIPVLNLPTDFPRPPVQRMEGSQVDIEIPPPLVEKIEKLALKTESTVYMVLLSIFNILLSQYSGQEDIILGVTTAGRRHADLEPVIGMFVNMLALRNHPRKNKTFKEFLINVRNNTLQAFEHQDYQYEELVRKLDLQGNPGRNALFDIVFKLESMEFPGVTIPGLKLKPYREYKDTTCKFDMVISAYHQPGSIFMNFKYSPHLFEEAYIRSMTNHFLEISRQVSANQQILLENIELSIKFAAAKVELHEEETLFGF
jgi:amino acid adenylation domain-containing protein